MSLAVSPLNLETRRAHDSLFALAYVVLGVATVVIFGISYGPAQGTLEKLVDNCTSTSTNTRAGQFRNAWVGVAVGDDDDHTTSDLMHAAPYLLSSLGFSVLVGVAWMALLRFFAKPVVYGTLVLKGVILIGLGVYLFGRVKTQCGDLEGDCRGSFAPLLLVGLGALYFAWLFCARSRIRMTAALIEQAVVVVSTHPGVFLASGGIFLLMVSLLVFCGATLILLVAAHLGVSTDPAATGVPTGGCAFEYTGSGGTGAQYVLVAAFLFWSVQLCAGLRYYVVSLTTGVWYYANEVSK